MAPSSPAAATTRCLNLIGGRWVAGSTGAVRDVVSPYTGTVVGKVELSAAADVDAAVAAARAGAAGWSAMPLKERSRPLFRFRELLVRHLDELANTAALEAGKTRAEARAGLEKGIEVVEFALSLQNLDDGRRPGGQPRACAARCGASRSAWSPASRPSTSRPWCRCGCSPSRSRWATPSSSSPRRRCR